MELIKKYHQKIIAITLIVLGPIIFIVFYSFRLGLLFYWYSAFLILFGLILLVLAEPKK